MKRLLVILLVLVVALSLTGIGLPPPVLAQDAPWPMFRHDPRHTGRSPHTGPEFAGEKWRFPTGGLVYSSPAVGSDGTIYVGSDDGNLYAINADGSPKWSFPTGGRVASSPAIGGDGTIYVGSYDNNLYAINPDGSPKWSFPTGHWVYSSPAVGGDGTIYVGSYDKNLYAINADGSPKWTFPTGDDVSSSPAVSGDGTIYVGSEDNNLYAINPDGSEKWSFPTGSWVASPPAIGGDGTIYVGSNDNKLYAIGAPPVLQVIKTGPAEARHGDQVTYKIKVCNVSETDAVSVTLTDILPDGLYYVSSNPSGTHEHGIVTWGLGEIAPTNCRSVYLTATVDCSLPDQAIVYDTAKVVWKDPCQNDYGPSTDVAMTWVNPALVLTKECLANRALPGETITYDITYRNLGTATFSRVVVTEVYDPYVEFVSATPQPDPGTDNRWTIGKLAPRSSGTIEVVVLVAEDVPDWTILTNKVSLTSAQYCHKEANDKTTVLQQPPIVIGGEVAAESKLEILATWFGLALVLFLAVGGVALALRRGRVR